MTVNRNINDPNLDQIVVRLWKACNFKCTFCNVAYNESTVLPKEEVLDLVRNFHYRFKYCDTTSGKIVITISWGEPTLFQKQFLFVLKYIRLFLEKKGIEPIFDLQTNASNIDSSFAKKIQNLGVSQALVSFHTINSNIFEKLIWVENANISKILNGIKNLHEAWIEVHFNTIVSKDNVWDFENTIIFLLKKFPKIHNYNLWVVQPHGHAYTNFEDVVVSYKDIYKVYNRVLFYLYKKHKDVVSHFTGLPRCYLDKSLFHLEWEDSLYLRRNIWGKDKNLVNFINEQNKTQQYGCMDCIYNNICSGVWNDYVGFQELQPVRYKKMFESDSKIYLLSKEEDIRVFKSKGIKNVVVMSSNKNFLELIKKLTHKWFFKVSLFLDKKISIWDEILTSWLGNIQTDISNISKQDIIKIIHHSKETPHQFMINLDICVYDKNDFSLRELYWQKYVKIFYIYDYERQNKEVLDIRDSNIFREYDNVFSVNFFSSNIY